MLAVGVSACEEEFLEVQNCTKHATGTLTFRVPSDSWHEWPAGASVIVSAFRALLLEMPSCYTEKCLPLKLV